MTSKHIESLRACYPSEAEFQEILNSAELLIKLRDDVREFQRETRGEIATLRRWIANVDTPSLTRALAETVLRLCASAETRLERLLPSDESEKARCVSRDAGKADEATTHQAS